jgi:hypothetical protein
MSEGLIEPIPLAAIKIHEEGEWMFAVCVANDNKKEGKILIILKYMILIL